MSRVTPPVRYRNPPMTTWLQYNISLLVITQNPCLATELQILAF
jgi:hypothetical protein